MNLDRNTIIGFVLFALLIIGYFYYTGKEQLVLQREKAKQDSIANAMKPKIAPNLKPSDTVNSVANQRVSNAGDFQQAANGNEQITYIKNGVLSIGFSNKGGQPKSVELLNFKGPDSTNVKLSSTEFDKISYTIATNSTTTSDITNLFFTGGQDIQNQDGTHTINYQLTAGTKTIVHQFIIHPGNYMIDFNIQVDGVNQLLSNNTLIIHWQNKALQLQKDLNYERGQSFVGYRVNNDYDHSTAMRSSSEDFNKPINWVSVKQQFFNTSIVAKNNFTSGNLSWTVPATTDQKTVLEAVANLKLTLPNTNNANIPLALYYGPTDYKTLKQYGNGMEEMVNLGSGIFSFVKYLNRWIIIPIFDLFSKLTSNFGIVILLLTLFIRLLISPLTYSSYLSGAKMKVLRPEIDKLKAKYGGDQQQMSVEQMKLFREAGVNPLGGCIPALFQIPIFFALYSFFNSNVALRGQSFLWAKDLSQYDSIWNFGVNVPFLGDHLSLFTLTAISTSFLISLYSMSMTPDQGNPVLKYMPYFFPIVLLFVFNKLPAGLTWYYTVSNAITLGLQFVIQNYIINHDKILVKMEQNKKKPKPKSKWAERMEQIQEQQKQMRDSQNKNKR